MSRVILLAGLRRSGLHASANALMGHFPGTVDLINDPGLDFAEDPIERRRYRYRVSPESIEARLSPALVRRLAITAMLESTAELPFGLRGMMRRWLVRSMVPIADRRPSPMPTFAPADGPADTVLVVLENALPQVLAEQLPVWLERNAELLGTDVAPREIGFVMRSPWNCLASHLQRPQLAPPRPIRPEEVRGHWKAFAREAKGVVAPLAAAGWTTWILNYDRYFSVVEERGRVAARWGVVPSELGLRAMADFGGGSSFSGRTVPERGLVTGARWQAFRQHPCMRALLTDEELIMMARELGFMPPDLQNQ